jgi:hypothetical protein
VSSYSTRQAPINLTIFLPGAENSRWQFEKRCWKKGRVGFWKEELEENACRIRGVVIEGGKGVGCTCETVTMSCDKPVRERGVSRGENLDRMGVLVLLQGFVWSIWEL